MGAAAGLAAAQGSLGMLGGLAQGVGSYYGNNFQAGVALQNAKLAKAAAGDALARGENDASRQRMKGALIEGEQGASFSASNVDIGSGSAAATLADTRMMSELDAQTIRNNAAREAWGYTSQEANYRSQAELDRFQGKVGFVTGALGGAGSGLGAAGGALGGKLGGG